MIISLVPRVGCEALPHVHPHRDNGEFIGGDTHRAAFSAHGRAYDADPVAFGHDQLLHAPHGGTLQCVEVATVGCAHQRNGAAGQPSR